VADNKNRFSAKVVEKLAQSRKDAKERWAEVFVRLSSGPITIGKFAERKKET
jgi:hypothetical protein